MRESGISMEEIDRFYAAGAFGKHVSKESAITIGMYPDMDRSRLICAGNTSLAGAEKILLDRTCIDDIDRILDEMVYIQFGPGRRFHLYDERPRQSHTRIWSCFRVYRRSSKKNKKRNNGNCLTAVELCHILTIDNENQ